MNRRRWLMLGGAAVLVGAGALVALPPSESQFYDYVAERRAAGKPVSFTELRPKPPDEENCAPELAAAFQALVDEYGPSEGWARTPFAADTGLLDATPEELDALAKLVERMRPGFDRLSAALAKPKFWMLVWIDKNAAPNSPRIRVAQNIQKALSMPAGSETDPERRLAACRDQFTLAQRLTPDSWLDWMVGVAVTSGGISSLRRGVESGMIDPVAARRECDAFLTRPLAAGFVEASRGEPVWLIEMYDAVVTGRAIPPASKRPFWKKLERRLSGAQSRMFDGMDVERGMSGPIVELCRTYEHFAAFDASRFLTPAGATELTMLPDVQAGPLGVAVPQLTRNILRTETAQRLARIALAAAAHRAETGAYPASLDELRPALGGDVPLDPYSGMPFVWETTPAGVRISSTGHMPPDPDEPNWRDLLIWELKR